MVNIAVLGAGVVGLSTAINIKRNIAHANVTVIADKFLSETTSSGAGGIFKPTTELTPGVPLELLKRWVSDSWKWFSDLTLSDMASVTGNQMVAGYYFCNKEVINPLYKDYVFSFSRMTDEELKRLNMFHRYKYGYHITTVITCVKDYLPWLTKTYLDSGGKIEGRTIHNIGELVGKYDVVVNCTGLGSRQLFNDHKIHAVRGQLIKLQADWIKYWMYTDDGSYILPNGDIITVGGVRQNDDYNIEISEKDREDIKQRCYKLWPPLKGAHIAGEWVGLRPSRTPLRLETELMDLPNGKLKVVHNYGHGGVGIALSWGTSLHATQMGRHGRDRMVVGFTTTYEISAYHQKRLTVELSIRMADLSKKEWEKYEKLEEANVFKNIATVMHKGIQPVEVAEFYDKWADDNNQYEKELPEDIYNAPIVTAASAADGLTDQQKATAKVFDVAAGTGMCAEQLKLLGFQHIDALDPSQGMLDRAKAKNLYERYICEFITDKKLDISDNTYDVLTVSAGFGEGHIPCRALYEMIRVVKPGGIIVIVTRHQHLESVEEYRDKLEPLMNKLETEKKWKKLERRIFDGFFLDKSGILWKYEVC